MAGPVRLKRLLAVLDAMTSGRARRWLVVGGALLAMSGLLVPPIQAQASDVSFGAPVQLGLKCPGQCREPTITADGSGGLYVMTYDARDIAVIHDGDVGHIEHRVGPSVVWPIFGDAIIESDRAGGLFIAGLEFPFGVGVFRSSDGARTWQQSVVATLPGADRPWMAFGPGGVVYLLYKVGVSEVVQTSVDHGATFGAPVLVSPPGRAVYFAGPAVVDDAGRLLLVIGTGPADLSSPPDLRLASSGDRGQTFAYSTIATQTSVGPLINYFPMLSRAADGTLRVAWSTSAGGGRSDVVVATSTDGGATWGHPVSWSGPDTLTAAPGLAPGDGVLNLMWYRVTSPGHLSSVVFARGAPDGTSIQSVVVADDVVAQPARPAPANEANTDFADFALLPDGRAAVVWWNNGAWIAVENPARRGSTPPIEGDGREQPARAGRAEALPVTP